MLDVGGLRESARLRAVWLPSPPCAVYMQLMSRTRIGLIVALGAALSACSATDLVLTPVGPDAGPAFDAGTLPQDAGQGGPLEIIESTRIREDFGSGIQVDLEASDVVIDTNRGVATLESLASFPTLAPNTDAMTLPPGRYNGVFEGRSLLLEAGMSIEATDSVELRAEQDLRIVGDIVAGAGGVTLIAGTGVYVDGSIQSAGPVRILVASEDGVANIAGAISTLPGAREPSAPIRILGRGRVRITGQLMTGSSGGASSGAITIETYGDIEVSGFETLLGTGPGAEKAGDIVLATETEIRVEDSARLTTGMDRSGVQPLSTGQAGCGDIELRAEEIRVGEGAIVEGGSCDRSAGGSVTITAGVAFVTDSGAQILGGWGDPNGGGIEIDAATATIAANGMIVAGGGLSEGGPLVIGTAGDLTIGSETILKAGDGDCGAGADITVSVAGVLRIEEGAQLRAGSGSGGFGESCFDTHAGGNVNVRAHEVQAEEGTNLGGLGSPAGEVIIVPDPSFTRLAPDIRTERDTGAAISKTFDRGSSASLSVPVLVDLRRETPAGTFAKIQLAGSADPYGPFETWYDVGDKDDQLLQPLRGLRYLRYRVWLVGRAFDVPEVDFFEIDLNP